MFLVTTLALLLLMYPTTGMTTNMYEIDLANNPIQNTTFLALLRQERMCGTLDPVEHVGVRGALSPGDCLALALFLREIHVIRQQEALDPDLPLDHLVYVESGSLLGLSAHVMASTAELLGVPLLVYAHDLFDSGEAEADAIWEHDLYRPSAQHEGSPEASKLQTFYEGVKRNNRQRVIIPIPGQLIYMQ